MPSQPDIGHVLPCEAHLARQLQDGTSFSKAELGKTDFVLAGCIAEASPAPVLRYRYLGRRSIGTPRRKRRAMASAFEFRLSEALDLDVLCKCVRDVRGPRRLCRTAFFFPNGVKENNGNSVEKIEVVRNSEHH